MQHKFIVIEGNIGSGKTSLSKMLSHQLNAKLILEQFDDNPFLPKFYTDNEKYAFPLELSFLAERYQQLKNELGNHDLFREYTISDYYFYKSLIFAKANLKADEYDLYAKLFTIIHGTLPKPDLLVYLYVTIEKLKKNILLRGRTYELGISEDYLVKIQSTYLAYLKQQTNMRILLLDVNNIDFVNNPGHYQKVLDAINQPYQMGINPVTF